MQQTLCADRVYFHMIRIWTSVSTALQTNIVHVTMLKAFLNGPKTSLHKGGKSFQLLPSGGATESRF